MTVEEALSLACAVAITELDWQVDPEPGDLVVERSNRRADPDGIGWLLGHGEAAYEEDGTGPTREVWDVLPLNPHAKLQTIDGVKLQRWENARFLKVPEHVIVRLGLRS